MQVLKVIFGQRIFLKRNHCLLKAKVLRHKCPNMYGLKF